MVFVCRRPRCHDWLGARAPGLVGGQSGWGRASRSVNGVRVSTACAARFVGGAPPAARLVGGAPPAARVVGGAPPAPLMVFVCRRPALQEVGGAPPSVNGVRVSTIGWGRAPGCQSGWGRASRSVNDVRVSTTPLHDSLGARPRLPEWLGARLPLR